MVYSQPTSSLEELRTAPCPVCTGSDVHVILDAPDLPVHCHLLCADRDTALAQPRGAIVLGFCRSCGHVFNLAFDPNIPNYDGRYENSLHFSPRFQQYIEGLAHGLIERHNLRGKHIVEIGSGRGDFLRMLCALGDNTGSGFDPSYTPDPVDVDPRIRFVADYYGESYADEAADLVCCRHVLEHIPQPQRFLHDVRRAMTQRPEAVVFFEVPNARFMLRDLSIWDIIYEHCGYFTASSLRALFRRCGFQVTHQATEFGDQFLTIEARLTSETAAVSPDPDVTTIAAEVTAFADNFRRRVDHWQERLGSAYERGRRAVVWGAGSKGITFLNIMGAAAPVQHIVDINPRKHGMYVAGGGQQIIAPEQLGTLQPDLVIIMNPIYKQEIEAQLAALDVHAEILCV